MTTQEEIKDTESRERIYESKYGDIIICASCQEKLEDEDLCNTTCLKCGGEAD